MNRTDPETAQFRARQREEVPSWYSPHAHLLGTNVLALSVIALAAAQLHQVQPWQWLTIPLTFLYANLSEYLGHRGPMHHRYRGLGLIHHRHSVVHHRYFNHRNMAFDEARDFKAVLFPLILIVFFFGLFGTPVWALLYTLFSANVAWLFVATAAAYFLNYEWLHFAYHCREEAWIMRVPGFRRLRQLHLEHHNPKHMSRCNFNITYPLCDHLFGTRFRADEHSRDQRL